MAFHWNIRNLYATKVCDLAHSDPLLTCLTFNCCGSFQSQVHKHVYLLFKGKENVYIYMEKIMQNIHIHRHCLWSVGARRAPTHNWIHSYTEAQLLHCRAWALREKRDLKYGLQILFMMTKNSPAGQWGQMLPSNYTETYLQNPKFPQPTPASRVHWQ